MSGQHSELGNLGKRAGNSPVEFFLGLPVLHPGAANTHIMQPQFNYCLLHKTGFLAVTVQQSKCPLRAHECQYQSWQTRATTHIQPSAWPQMWQYNEAVE